MHNLKLYGPEANLSVDENKKLVAPKDCIELDSDSQPFEMRNIYEDIHNADVRGGKFLMGREIDGHLYNDDSGKLTNFLHVILFSHGGKFKIAISYKGELVLVCNAVIENSQNFESAHWLCNGEPIYPAIKG